MLKEANKLRAQSIKESINSIIPEQISEVSRASFDALKQKLIDGLTELAKQIEAGAPQDVIDRISMMLQKEANALKDFATQQNNLEQAIQSISKVAPEYTPYFEAQYKTNNLLTELNSDNFTNKSYN